MNVKCTRVFMELALMDATTILVTAMQITAVKTAQSNSLAVDHQRAKTAVPARHTWRMRLTTSSTALATMDLSEKLVKLSAQ